MIPYGSHAQTEQTSGESGFTIFFVLSFLMLASAIVTPFVINAKINALIARNTARSVVEKAKVRGLMEIASVQYFSDRAVNSDPKMRNISCNFGETLVRFSFQDHRGLIDINYADQNLLALGFIALGEDLTQAKKLASELAKARTELNQRSIHDKQGMNWDQGFKGPFQNVFQISDYSEALKNDHLKVRQIFTVFTGLPTVSKSYASIPLISAVAQWPINDQPFVVESTESAGVVTVQVHLSKPETSTISGTTTYAKDVKTGIPNRVEGLSFEISEPVAVSESFISTISCAAYFSPKLIETMKILLT